MKKVLFSILLLFILIMNVNADEKYNFSRIDFETISGDYDSVILDDKFYLMGEQYTCIIDGEQDNSCNLYRINDSDEIEKANNKFYYTGRDPITKLYFLKTQKNEDGSYDLYSCTSHKEDCTLIEDIDVSALYSSYERYYEEKDDIYHEVQYYIVKDKDNKFAIYDGKGIEHLEFGDYKIVGEETFSEDGINAELWMLVLKNNSNGSYIFIGEDDKVVTLTKDIADKIGINDERILTVEHQVGNYYSFEPTAKTKYFTLTEGLINNKEFSSSYISYYNKELIIDETDEIELYKKLYKLDGTSILPEGLYNDLLYFNDRPEMILSKTDKNLEIFDGNSIIYTKTLEEKFKISEALIDSEGTIWIDARENEEFPVVYILRANKIETPNYECKEVDGKYYSKDGSVVDKKTYESVCGLDDNPHTGQAISILFVSGLIGLALFIRNKKKSDVLKKI